MMVWTLEQPDTNKKTTGATGKGSDSLRATELRPILGQAQLVSVVARKLPSGNAIVNPENVSKIIDANGDPLEVYHRTDADSGVFAALGGND